MGNRRALIVANDTYHHPGLKHLTSPIHDAEALQGVLADPGIGDFEVTIIYNQPAHVIQREVADFLAQAVPDDLLVLHFSCHGLKNASGELYLAGIDSIPNRLSATAVAARFVNEEITSCRASRIVLLLDCCYGGAFARGTVVRAADEVDIEESFPLSSTGRGRAVITASSATQYAFEDDQLTTPGQRQPSIFTRAMVQGLSTGEADTDADGHVDLDELYDYIWSKVQAATAHQTPSKWVANMQGKLVVAWTPLFHRIVPDEVPDELAARVHDSLAEVRLGAVNELRAHLLGQDVPRAAAALRLLQQLADDDSLRVRTNATNAIAEAQLRPTDQAIELNETEAQTVQLIGSPLSRVFRATTASRWLRVDQSESSLQLKVDPAAFPDGYGDLRGSITVSTRIGEFEIPVMCRLPGRLWPRAPIVVSDLAWIHSWKALSGAAVALTGAELVTSGPFLNQSSALGIGYLLIRFTLLWAGIILVVQGTSKRIVGHGLVAASTAYFLTDAVVDLYRKSTIAEWLLFFAVVTFAVLLAIRLWPFPAVPRGLRILPPTVRPLAWIPLATAAMQVLVLFVAVPQSAYPHTIAEYQGVVGGLLAVVPIAGLCVAATLSATLSIEQRTFVTATLLAYVLPELYLMLGSLLLGPQFTYLGDDLWIDGVGDGLAVAWYVVLLAAVSAAQTASTLLIVRGGKRR